MLLAKGLPALQLLHVRGNNIGPVGAAAIAQHCSLLQQLDLAINRWGELGGAVGAVGCVSESVSRQLLVDVGP